MRKRYQVVFFPMFGLQIEGMLLSTGRRYSKIKTFFSGNVYRVKNTKISTRRWIREY